VKRVLVLALVLGGAVASSATAAPRTGVSFRATIAPREALWGDVVEGRVVVIVEPALADPRSVRVHVDLRPYAVVSTDVTRDREGAFVRVTHRYRLRCLDRPCLPGRPERLIDFRPLRITWTDRGGLTQTQTVFWPPLELASRVNPKDLAEPTLRSEVARQPPVTWRVRPSLAIAGLLVVAGLLLLYPVLLVSRLARRGWRVWRTSRLDRLSPLERALELLRRAAQGGEDERSRLALERVSRELHGHELGEDASRLAWSRPAPDRDEMETLRERVEEHR
jgi:hypothetical protein